MSAAVCQLVDCGTDFMEIAFDSAEEALANQEVPIGCVFVLDGREVVARGRNRVNETKNACLHAEFVCLEQILASHGRQALARIDVYVTVEPCIMCASMFEQVGVRKIVYGAHNERFGGLGSVLNVLAPPDGEAKGAKLASSIEIVSGVQKERAVQLLKQFYQGENPNAPQPKPKRKNKDS
ncbi:tRNA-specific adenosine deaminase 2-like [Tropilaelaps mercedesae]|uniref:tRNA-specific adenosine deaminase 2-like n=1 Tax=Tropilaelaps mercedesae TaxID=418985 RepID=A0A1V9XIP3_9ACAR|nr:tRNA-specific adenosine deaminase 2-like [Tropilaelaps mercedesae]